MIKRGFLFDQEAWAILARVGFYFRAVFSCWIHSSVRRMIPSTFKINEPPYARLSLGTPSTMQIEIAWTNTTKPLIADQLVTAAKEVQCVLYNETAGSSNVVIAHYGASVVRVYVGRRISQVGVAATVVQDFIDRLVNSKARRGCRR